MATSSKTTFKLETLQEKAVESIDERIAQKHLEVAAYGDRNAQRNQQAEWRARQEIAISRLFNRLGDDVDEGDLSDEELSRFKIEPLPKVDSFARDRAVRELRALEARRSQIEAKAASLVPDEDGSIALTKTQLKEFFDL